MVSSDKVERSKKIQKETGKTFYFATKMLPKDIRHETYVLYAFFRKADEIVDTTDPGPNQDERLESFKRQAKGLEETEDIVIESFNEVRKEKDIADGDVDSFINAMKMDIEKNVYEEFDEVREYMDGSAAAVGRMMTSIMDTEEENKALPHATALGEAYQMTNFIRDVGEDIREYDRIYIPGTTREKFGVTREQIEDGVIDESFKRALEAELKRTEVLYEEGVKGIKYLPEDAQFGVFLSAVLYSEHHRIIRENNYDVLNNDLDISRVTKLKLLPRAYWHWKRSSSPIEAFRKSSSIYREVESSVSSDERIAHEFEPINSDQ